MNQEDYEFIRQSLIKMFSELNHRIFIRSGDDFLLSPEVDKLAKAANWMLKAWYKCFEFYATPNNASTKSARFSGEADGALCTCPAKHYEGEKVCQECGLTISHSG